MALDFLKAFRKEIAKHETINVGFSKLDGWVTTGNYALNRALSGDFLKGIPLCKPSLMTGPSGCLPAEEKIDVYIFQTDPGFSIKIEKE